MSRAFWKTHFFDRSAFYLTGCFIRWLSASIMNILVTVSHAKCLFSPKMSFGYDDPTNLKPVYAQIGTKHKTGQTHHFYTNILFFTQKAENASVWWWCDEEERRIWKKNENTTILEYCKIYKTICKMLEFENGMALVRSSKFEVRCSKCRRKLLFWCVCTTK